MGGKLSRQVFYGCTRYAAKRGILVQTVGAGFFLQQLQGRGRCGRGSVGQRYLAAKEKRRRGALPRRGQLSLKTHDQGLAGQGGTVRAFLSRGGQAQYFVLLRAGKADQVGGVGKGRFPGRSGGLQGGVAQKGRVVTRVFQNPADHAQGQGRVCAGPHRHPAGPVARGVSDGKAQYRVNDHIVQVAQGAGLGHHAGRAVEGVARLGRGRAPE